MTPSAKLPLREKMAYGFGDLASVLYWQTFMAYLLFFYTDVYGLSAAVAGTMFLVSRVLDAITDPAMGLLADRTQTRWGKFRPYLLWLCAPYAVVGVLTFTVPALGDTGKLLWAILTYNALMLLYTAINIPYTAMLGVLTPHAAERTSLASIKFLFAYAAGIIVSATLLPLTKALGGDDPARGWQLAFAIIGVAFIVFFLIAFLGTTERVRPAPNQRTSVRDDLRDLLRNRAWIVLLTTTLALILFVATRITATAHYFKYYVGSHTLTLPFAGGPRTYGFEELVSAFNTLGQAASIAGVLLVSWFTRRIGGKKRAFSVLLAVSVLSTAGYYVLGPDQLAWIFVLQFTSCVTAGPLSALLWSMYADTADYGEWQTGRRATGLVFSASTMGQKVGWAIGSACAGWMLSFSGFQANTEQSPETLHGLVLLVSLIPAVFGGAALALLRLYPLDEVTTARIGDALQERRAAAAAVAAP